MRPEIPTIVFSLLAVAFAVVACIRDLGGPWVGFEAVVVGPLVLPSLAVPVIAGWLVKTGDHE
jgi:hypothetical protein